MNTMKNDQVSTRLSFDGFGFNDANNEYRERVATLSSYGKELPKAYHDRIVRAVNNFESLLVACKFVLQEWDEPESAPQCLEMLRKAIANAEK